MKLGIIISVVVVTFFGIIGIVSFRGVAEAPSAATRPAKLVQHVLPATLPILIKPSNPTKDATAVYRQAFDFFSQNKTELSTEPPQPELAAKVADLLIAAAQNGGIAQDFLDVRSPIDYIIQPSNDEAVKTVAHATLVHSEDMAQFHNPQRAKDAALAVWVLGRRAFNHNTRLDYRWQGLAIMTEALTHLTQLAERDQTINQDPIWEWLNAVQDIDSAWQQKYQLIAQVRPHIGDLLNVARHDKDKTFRVEALLKLGIIKFAPGTRGNHRHIVNTIQEYTTDPDTVIQQAATAAKNLSKEDLHKIY